MPKEEKILMIQRNKAALHNPLKILQRVTHKDTKKVKERRHPNNHQIKC